MSDAINRITGEFLKSVNDPYYPKEDFLLNPDLSAVKGVPQKYWKLDGDIVLEMNAVEKSIVDARITEEIRINEEANPTNIMAEHTRLIAEQTEVLVDIGKRLDKLEGI